MKTQLFTLMTVAALSLSRVAFADDAPATTPAPQASGDAGQSKSGPAPGGNASTGVTAPTTTGSSAPAGSPATTGDAGQSKSGADPGSNANPTGVTK